METINSYLETMFKGLPQTEQVLNMKQELLNNMQDKYNELKNAGKSENEAIGIVISEFGNIDELVKEMGITVDNSNSAENNKELPYVSKQTAEEYIKVKKVNGIRVGLGVAMILFGVVFLVTISAFQEYGVISMGEDKTTTIGVIILLLLVIAAVGVFIYSGSREEEFKYIESGIRLDDSTKREIESLYRAEKPVTTLAVIFGVCLCIAAVFPVLISTLLLDSMKIYQALSVPVMLLMISVAVFLFIAFGSIKEAYEKLLQIGDYTINKKKNEKIIGAVASIVWPITTAVFLAWGFLYGAWHIAWIVFPIVGVLFGGFSAVYNALNSDK